MVEGLARINVNLIGVDRLRADGIFTNEDTARIVNHVAKHALFAYQAHVPINTGELRNTQIQANFANSSSLQARVYVVDVPHQNSWGDFKVPASLLALLLDTGDYRRSRTSERSDLDFYGFRTEDGLTEGWIGNAGDDFDGWLSSADLSNV